MTLNRWDWLLVSLALGALGSLIRWLVDRQIASGPTVAVSVWEALDRILGSPWLMQALRIIYAVGLPAAALFGYRALSARGLGLKPLPAPGIEHLLGTLDLPTWTDWMRDLGVTIAIAAGFWLVVLAGDRAARRWATVALPQRTGGVLAVLREAVIYQAHWAFYREPFVFTWGPAVGPWLAALLILAQVLINPLFWERLRAGGAPAGRPPLIRAGIFVASTLVFLQTQSLWMALLLDLLVGWLALAHRPAPSTAPPSSHMAPQTARHPVSATPRSG